MDAVQSVAGQSMVTVLLSGRFTVNIMELANTRLLGYVSAQVNGFDSTVCPESCFKTDSKFWLKRSLIPSTLSSAYFDSASFK